MTRFLTMRFVAVLIVFQSSPAFCWIRIANRTSTFCASLLNTTRAATGSREKSNTLKQLSEFRQKTLGLQISDGEHSRAIRAMASENPKTIQKISDRILSVEQAFKATSEGKQFIFGQIQLEGEEAIDQFFEQLALSREEFIESAKSSLDQPKDSLRGLLNYSFQTGMYVVSPMLAFMSANMSALTGLVIIALVTGQKDFPPPLDIVVLQLAMAASGSLDYWVRFLNSLNYSHSNLIKNFKKLRSSNANWMYWSRDMRVNYRFFATILSLKKLSWSPSIQNQNFFEEASGLFRLKYWLIKSPDHQPFDIKVDFLIERPVDAPPILTLVLRSSLAD